MPSGMYKHEDLSEEHKENISKGLKESNVLHSGQFKPGFIPWNKKNFGSTTYKELNHNLRTSKKWNKWRKQIFMRDNWTCQNCDTRGITLHPHHIVSVKQCVDTKKIDLIYNINNGVTLCFDCHWDKHRKINESKGLGGD